MQQQEELELIRRIVNGETDLYAILARRYGRVVYTLVSRIVGCAEDAEELAQDVFLKAFRNLHRFNGRSSFPTWLFRIAYNTAISSVRKKRYEFLAIEETTLENVSEEEITNLFGQTESTEQVQRLEVALEQLLPDSFIRKKKQ